MMGILIAGILYKFNLEKTKEMEHEYNKARAGVSLLNYVGQGKTATPNLFSCEDPERVGNDEGVKIEKLECGYHIYFGSNLEKALDSICENYNKSSGDDEVITAEQIRKCVTEDTKATRKAVADGDESNVVYKVFKWMGTSCSETAIFDDRSEKDRKLWEKTISSGNYSNYCVILIQMDCASEGIISPIKFKWQ